MKHSKNDEQSWLTFQTEKIKERGHAQTSILKTRTSVKSCALVKITDGQVGHSILTSGPNLARGPGFEHPCASTFLASSWLLRLRGWPAGN